MRIQSFIFFILFFNVSSLLAQSVQFSGRILDEDSAPLIGATVVIDQLNTGTITDLNGEFKIGLSPDTYSFTVRYVGYITYSNKIDLKQGNQYLDVYLKSDVLEMESIVVSANVNDKTKLESSVSISTIHDRLIQQVNPTSAFDALKMVPGMFVNDANGEIGVEILGRGLSTPYFSIQEDGMPTTFSEMASLEGFKRDMFLRNDLTTKRIEVVRGGSASILAANAPGGVINYISRIGKDDFEVEFRNKFGLQANQNELYNKFDFFAGGPIGLTDWHYGVGGHLRLDGGNRITPFLHSQGGMVKLNLSKVFSDQLSVRIFTKYLNDRVGLNRPTLVQNWHDIQPAEGFDFDKNLVLPDATFSIVDGRSLVSNPNNPYKTVKTRDQQKVKERSIGFEIQYEFKNDVYLKSLTKISNKSISTTLISENGGMASIDPNSLFARLFSNFNLFFDPLNPLVFGDFEFFDISNGDALANISTAPLALGRPPQEMFNHLPGEQVFWALVRNDELRINEWMQNLTLSKQIDNHFLSIGGYFSLAKNKRDLNAGTSFLTIEENPRLLGVRVNTMDFSQFSNFVAELKPVEALGNTLFQFSSPSGLHGFNTPIKEYNDLNERVMAVYASDELKLTDKVNLDIGVRYEMIQHKGSTGITKVYDDRNEEGGLDGNITTVYDNIFEGYTGDDYDVNLNYNGLSYSIGLNYQINKSSAIYGRFSKSDKLIDAIYPQDGFVNGEPQKYEPRKVIQSELGYKWYGKNIGLFAIGYHSFERNIFDQLLVVSLQEPDGFYLTPPHYNSIINYGAEIEMFYKPVHWFDLRSVVNLSGGKNHDFKVWDTGESDSPIDDVLVDLSGKPVAGSTARALDLSPIDLTGTFKMFKGKGNFVINYRHYAERFANIQQAFNLPAFSIWRTGFSYQMSKNFWAQLQVNNIFDTIGILNFNGTDDVAGFPEKVTTNFINQFPNKQFRVQRTLGRAIYLTIEYTL